MANPWLKKNPFMSMWLSGANAVASSMRGQAAAQAKRQSAAVMAEASKNMLDFWTGGMWTPPPTKKRRRSGARLGLWGTVAGCGRWAHLLLFVTRADIP